MKPFIQITQPNGFVYEIKTEEIAKHRAEHMLATNPEQFKDIDEAMAETLSVFDTPEAIQTWAATQMQHEPLRRFVRAEQQELPAWHAGTWAMRDTPALGQDLDGETLMSNPLEVTVATMTTSSQMCSLAMAHNKTTGEPFCVVAVMVGNSRVLDGYVKTLEHATKFIAEAEAAAANAADAPAAH